MIIEVNLTLKTINILFLLVRNKLCYLNFFDIRPTCQNFFLGGGSIYASLHVNQMLKVVSIR